MTIQSYKDLEVWKCAMDLAEQCYSLTKNFPREELFGLTSQIRRAAVSVPANIAEGYGREHTGEYIQHLGIANGSLKELETHLILCCRIRFIEEPQLQPLLSLTTRIGQMLWRLSQALKKRK